MKKIFLLILFIFIIFSCTTPGEPEPEPKYNTELHLEHISVYLTDPPNDVKMDDALINVINSATTGEGNLDICFYGLNRENVIVAIENAIANGVHVRFVGNNDSSESYYDGYRRRAQALDTYFTDLDRAINLESDFDDFKLINSGAIMHNKFVLAVDNNNDKWLYMGTTNCTDTGFLNNNNNSIVFQNTDIYNVYSTQFEHLLNDTPEVSTVNCVTIDGIKIEILFAPNVMDSEKAMHILRPFVNT